MIWFSLDGVSVEYDGSDFVWEEYLEETGSVAVPNEAFKHVSVCYSIRLINCSQMIIWFQGRKFSIYHFFKIFPLQHMLFKHIHNMAKSSFMSSFRWSIA